MIRVQSLLILYFFVVIASNQVALFAHNFLQEAELIQQKAVLENRIRKLNEEAEIARLQSDRLNRRIEFLEERAAESSSTTSRQISELTDEVRQLQADLHAEKLLSSNFAREAEDARHALDAADRAKQVNRRWQLVCTPLLHVLFMPTTSLRLSSLESFCFQISEQKQIADLEDLVSVVEEQRDEALDRIIRMESNLQVRDTPPTSQPPFQTASQFLQFPPRPSLSIAPIHLLSQSAQSTNDTLSANLQAAKQLENQLETRLRALSASLQKIETEVANDADDSSASMAAAIEESRRWVEAVCVVSHPF